MTSSDDRKINRSVTKIPQGLTAEEKMKIRFCEHNKGTGKVFKKLKEEYPELNIKRKDCLKNCGACHKSPFALVRDKRLVADDADELYREIVAAITGSTGHASRK